MRDPLAEYGVRPVADALARRNGQPVQDKASFRPAIVSRCMADVDARTMDWLIPGIIPAGRLTVIAGDGGLGKSFATLSLAAILSRGGTWPNGEPCDRVGTTVLLNAEDDPHDTIRVRLDQHAADCTRIHVIDGVKRTHDGDTKYLSLADDVRALESMIADVGARLCVVDPVGAYLGGVDSHKDADVRTILGPLAGLAQRTACAIVAVMHLNKGASTKAASRVSGSVGFSNAARMAWLVGADPEDEASRVRVPYKCNVIESPQGLAFRIVDGRVDWSSTPTEVDAADVLGADAGSRKEREEAIDFLTCILAPGPLTVKEIKAAAESEGHAWRTISRAKKALKIRSDREGFGSAGHFKWVLPKAADNEA